MRASLAYTMRRSVSAALFGASLAIGAPVPACANVITDWDDKALVLVTPMTAVGATSPYMAQRMMAMVHAAMFDAVNSIERRYQPYLVQLPADPATSKEAAAAAAAAALLATINEKTAAEVKTVLTTYLASIPDGAAKSNGVKLGEAIAVKLLDARANDGSDAPDDYRPRTAPGVYVPTAITISTMWATMKPFVMDKRVPVPAGPADCAGGQGVGSGLQRAQGVRRAEQRQANGRADRDSPVLAARSTHGLSSVPAPARDRKADGCG